ncbi:YdcF family protein [Beijerinckia indica]|uniref:DUF218 domain-containing protein n=1 Tax=Beijerinckia indica subsp. indica (strain ATCC 9039 / DSM 1715 / NCIMB 8712) TaxID=395963 RepID=B2IC49_BEII9|nr:YdcF family protein [Beijerinckia indica]ACB95304.1 protein of unknown function DUF218 [Beijerinckia indica subsp. indica ATCC 9039]
MFFNLSKIFWLFAEPGSFIILLGLLGLILVFTPWVKAGQRLQAIAILLLAFVLLTPFGAFVVRPLEDRFPNPDLHAIDPAGIIVLGGGMDSRESKARGVPILNTAGSRMTAGVELSRLFPQAKLIFTGGSGDLMGDQPSESIYARELWQNLGVPAEQMVFEGNSRNTWENAVFTRDLIKPKPEDRYLLVTSAAHMPRSVGIFRKVGFNVIPYNANYMTIGDARDWSVTTLAHDRLRMLSFGLREWIGLLAYRLTGKTSDFFPGPVEQAATYPQSHAALEERTAR